MPLRVRARAGERERKCERARCARRRARGRPARQTCWFLRVRVRLSRKPWSCSSSILMLCVSRPSDPARADRERARHERVTKARDAPRDERLGLFCLHRTQVHELNLLVELEVLLGDIAAGGRRRRRGVSWTGRGMARRGRAESGERTCGLVARSPGRGTGRRSRRSPWSC